MSSLPSRISLDYGPQLHASRHEVYECTSHYLLLEAVSLVFAAASFFLAASMALKISGPRLNPCLLTGPVYVPLFHISESPPELWEVVLHSEYECGCERDSLALRRRVKERSESEDAGFGACLFKEAVEDGRPPTEREWTCETRSRGTNNEDGYVRLNEFRTGFREVPIMCMQDNESDGGAQRNGGWSLPWFSGR